MFGFFLLKFRYCPPGQTPPTLWGVGVLFWALTHSAGAPGSGKSTYFYGRYQLFTALESGLSHIHDRQRFNPDSANDNITYPCAIGIALLITLQDAMDAHGLVPNSGMLYCTEYLEVKLVELPGPDVYIPFDATGQVELGTINASQT